MSSGSTLGALNGSASAELHVVPPARATFSSAENVSPPDRIEVVDVLRGLASLAVCVFHCGRAESGGASMLGAVGQIGWLGVEVFFVISGFVIPWSLWRASYEWPSFPRFVARRIIRLDPPYFAAIALILALNWLSSLVPGYRGESFQIAVPALLGHVAYLNGLLGLSWLNVVFWTLAIEFQFYLFAGLAFPLIRSARALGFVAFCLLCLTASFLIPSEVLLLRYLPLFVLGFVSFRARVNGWRTWSAFVFLCAFGVLWIERDFFVAGVTGSVALVIVFCRRRMPAFLLSLGAVSYSLYLVHVPVGGRVVNLLGRVPALRERPFVIGGAAVLASLAAAWVFYYAFERPAQRLASRIALKPAVA